MRALAALTATVLISAVSAEKSLGEPVQAAYFIAQHEPYHVQPARATAQQLALTSNHGVAPVQSRLPISSGAAAVPSQPLHEHRPTAHPASLDDAIRQLEWRSMGLPAAPANKHPSTLQLQDPRPAVMSPPKRPVASTRDKDFDIDAPPRAIPQEISEQILIQAASPISPGMSQGFEAALTFITPTAAQAQSLAQAYSIRLSFVEPIILILGAALAFQKPLVMGLLLEYVSRMFVFVRLKAKFFIMEDKGATNEGLSKYKKWLGSAWPKVTFLTNVIDLNAIESSWKRLLFGHLPLNRMMCVLHLSNMFIGYLKYQMVKQMKTDYTKKVLPKATTDTDKAKADALSRKLNFMQGTVFLSFFSGLLDLRFRKFQWDIVFPAQFRTLLLRARWRVASNRQQLYALHTFLLLGKDLPSPRQTDDEQEQQDVEQQQGNKDLGDFNAADFEGDMEDVMVSVPDGKFVITADVERGTRQIQTSDIDKFSVGQQLVLSPTTGNQEEVLVTKVMRDGLLLQNKLQKSHGAGEEVVDRAELTEVNLEASAAPLPPKQRHANVNRIHELVDLPSDLERTLAIPELQMNVSQHTLEAMMLPIFLETTTHTQGVPQFAKFGLDPKRGARILGVDEESFDPATSAPGPPPPKMCEDAQDCMAQEDITKRATFAAMTAYLNYGLQPCNQVDRTAVVSMHSIVWIMNGVSLGLKTAIWNLGNKVAGDVDQKAKHAIFMAWQDYVCGSIMKGMQVWLAGTRFQYAILLTGLKASNTKLIDAFNKQNTMAQAVISRQMWYTQYPNLVKNLQFQTLLEVFMAVALQRKVETSRQLFQISYNELGMYKKTPSNGFNTFTLVALGDRDVDDFGL